MKEHKETLHISKFLTVGLAAEEFLLTGLAAGVISPTSEIHLKS